MKREVLFAQQLRTALEEQRDKTEETMDEIPWWNTSTLAYCQGCLDTTTGLIEALEKALGPSVPVQEDSPEPNRATMDWWRDFYKGGGV